MQTLGVDFSGARGDRNTWITEGTFDDNCLTLNGCYAISRSDLSQRLLDLPADSVVALDFPFSVPLSFAKAWSPASRAMPDLWREASETELEQFIEHRNAFVAEHGEMKRTCDRHYPESYSCLHMTNPNMVPMTFRGMQMLHKLWHSGCRVPPLNSPDNSGATLLESMPGAVLRALGLPFKGYKKGTNAHVLRRTILTGLVERVSFDIAGLDRLDDTCMSIDDALDATVASVCAALWVSRPELFRLPPPQSGSECDESLDIEGWLYAPSVPGSSAS